jgi:hypothetical protein
VFDPSWRKGRESRRRGESQNRNLDDMAQGTLRMCVQLIRGRNYTRRPVIRRIRR